MQTFLAITAGIGWCIVAAGAWAVPLMLRKGAVMSAIAGMQEAERIASHISVPTAWAIRAAIMDMQRKAK